MKCTARFDIMETAEKMLKAVQKLHDETAAKIEKLNEDKDTKPEVLKQRKEVEEARYLAALADIRAEYGCKIDRAADELRKLSGFVKPRQINPANAGIIQMLSLSPEITWAMLERAAESVGDDATAREILTQIAQRSGYEVQLGTKFASMPIDRHLTKEDIERIADSVQSDFCFYLDANREFAPPDAAIFPAENFINNAERTEGAARIEAIKNGIPFNFNGDAVVTTEFGSLEATAEL